MGSRRPGSATWKACRELFGWLRQENIARRCPVSRGDVKTPVPMLQLTSRFDSSAPAAVAASAPRMGNDENRAGGAGGPATSVIAKVKPKTKRPNLYRG